MDDFQRILVSREGLLVPVDESMGRMMGSDRVHGGRLVTCRTAPWALALELRAGGASEKRP